MNYKIMSNMKNLKSIIALLVLTVFSVNVWGSWTRVTTIEELTDGGTFIMGYEATAKSGVIVPLRSADCNATTSANGYFYTGTTASSSTNGTINMSTITTTTDYEIYITSPSGGVINIQMKTAGGSFYGASSGGSSKNTGRLYTSGNSSETNLIPEFANETNNQFKLSTSVTGTYKFLKYNTSSPRFAFYDSNGSNIVFYKKEADCTAPTATSNGSTTKTSQVVNWTDATGSAWDIYYSTSSTTPTTQTTATGLTEKTYTFSGLTPNTKYYWWIRTNCGSGSTSAWKAGTAFTTNAITFTDYITECSGDPEISVSPDAVEGLGYVYGMGTTDNTVKTFMVVGSNLSQNVTITAPTWFEVKQEGGNFADAIDLVPTDGLLNKTISVRLSSGKTAGNYNGNVTISSTEIAESKSVALSATVTPAPLATPSVTATPAVHQITLNWNEVPNASSYQLVWNDGTPETVTSPVVKDKLTGGQSYSYSLVAVGTGNYSNSEAAASSAIAGKETYTVKFFNSGSELTELEKHIEEGATFGTLPTLTETDACDPHSRTFVGWMIGTIDGKSATAPTTLVTTSTPVTEPMELNAVWAEEVEGTGYASTPEYTLSFSKINYDANHPEYSSYGDAHDWTSGTIDWSIIGNQTIGDYIRVGGKSVTNVNRISYSKSTISDKKIAKVVLSHNGKTNNGTINSVRIEGSINSDFASNVLGKTMNPSIGQTSGTVNFILDDSKVWEANSYFKFIVNFTNSESSNGGLDVISLAFYTKNTTYSNYLTTCSSDPLIEVSTESLSNFSTIATAGPSAAQSFTVEGYNLTEDITISVSNGYEICQTEGGTYSSEDITLPLNDGKVAQTPVYVRLAATDAAAASVAGNISLTSAGATEKNISLTGEVIAAVTVTFNNNGTTTDAPAAIKLGKGGTLGSNLPGVGTMTAPISGYTFVGWVADGDKWNGFTPSLTKSLITGNEIINADVTYDAVWAKGSNDFELMGNSDPFIDGNYIITYYSSYYGLQAMGNVVSGSNITTIEVDDQDEGIISNNTEAKVVWTLHKTGTNTVTFYNADKGQYLQGTSSALSFTNTPVDWTWSMTPGEEGYAPEYTFSIGTNGLYYWSNEFQYHNSPDPLYIYKQQLNNYFVTTPNEYTVTWHRGNAEAATTPAFEGQTFADIAGAAPVVEGTAAGDCANTFMGWATSAITKDEATEEDVSWAKNNTTPISGDVEYYAVFAEAEQGESGTVDEEYDFSSSIGTNWTTSDIETYFSKPCGIKKANAYIMDKAIADFSNYAGIATSITIGVTSFQNSGTTSILTVYLVDEEGNTIGTGKTITPANGSGVSSAVHATVEFDATSGATGYMVKCTTYGKNILITATDYSIEYNSATYSNYVTQCTPTYTVNFFINSGDAEPYATQKVEEGSKATAPDPAPTKAGATLGGWFTANDEALADKTITEATDFIAKWNYTAPTITEQPQGGEYTIGSVVTLVVVAEPITGVTFTYQWQRWNGSEYEDIAGATIYAYTAPTNQESQNTYRCVVTNGEASTPSAPAQVTVRPASYCAMPTIRIDELGEATAFIREATVTMECGNDGATIYYTLDGSDPKAVGATPNTYSIPFTIDATTTVKAYATATDLEQSSVQTKTFTKATLQSIAVETEPKKEYTALETFDPAGLVITANYDYSLSEEIDYANHSGEFTFTPTLTTELGVDVEAVKIGWGGKEVEQQITINCIAIDAPSVEVSKQGSTGITLTWDAVDNAASYQVKWNGGEAETATSPYVKTGLKDYTLYTYEVIAIGNTNYCTSTTGVQNVKTNTKSCESITNPSIDKVPTEFYVGEEVLRTHFKVDKNYDNGEVINDNPSSITLPDGIANPLTNDAVGTQTVTLTFNSKTTTIEITVKPQPVVTWSINGNEDNKQSFAYNAALVLPEAPAAPQTCAEKTFVGWTTETYKDYDSDDAPTVLFTEAGDRKVTEDVTYYAVFAMVENAEINTVLTEIFDDNQTTDSNSEFDKNTFSNFNGNCSKAYKSKYGGVKLGSSSASGYITSKELDLSKPTTITFDVKQYDEDEKSVTVTIVNNENQSESVSKLYSCTTDELETAVLNFDASYTKAVVKITTTSSSHRIYVDNVKIEVGGEIISSAYSTKCAARTPQSIAITHEATTTTFDVNDAFTSEGLEITAYYDSGDPQVVTGYCVITAPDMTTANEKDVNISYTENDATVNTSYKINVRQPYYVMYESNGATGSVPSDTKKYYTGEKVTVLANESLVKTDNVFKGWNYAGVTYQADDQITVGTENITLTAVWEEKMPCTITLSENGNTSTVTDKFTGDNYTLPAAITNNVDGYAFMGWSIQEIDEPVATTEQGTFFAKGEEISLIESAYTFYAVYARTSGTSSDYNAGKVTTSSDIVAGGLYIIEQAGHVLSSPASDKKVPTEATYKTSGLSATESYVWTLETSTNGFYLKNMSDNKYLKTNNDGDMSSVTNGPSEWVFAFQIAGYWKISASTSSRFLGFTGESTYLYKAYSNTNYDLTKVNVQYAAQINIYRLVGGYTTAPTITVNGTTEQTVPTTFHGNVIVENVGAITLDEPTTWKNLTIKNGAKVTTKAALSINNLLIETKMGAGTGKTNSPNMKGACGQLIIGDGGSVTASGSAIIENQIDPTGTATQGWYSFSVPFPVSAQNGIYFGDAKLTNGVDYAIMEYLGDVRAQGQYGWKKYSGILQPGKMYVIAVTDSDFGKLRFKKTADGDLIATNSWTAGIYGGGDDANWNAIGNPNLAISQFVNNGGVQTLQLYDHTNNTFTVHQKGDLNIVVGSGFFIQAVADYPNITMKVAEGDRGYRAPAEDIEEMPFVAIQLLQGDAMNDQVFLNADVNATLSYEIGRDVAKIFMQGDAKCAQIYVPAYGTNLCVAQFPLNANDETMFPLTITAPKDGTYTIAAENVQENINIFLEQNGALIWNLSTSAYEINLNKGVTTEYSIRWIANSPSSPTNINGLKGNNKAQKIFYQQNIYILQENQMYNAQGIKIQ